MRQEQAYETRSKLLKSARKLFAENGFAGTQVRSISRNVGMADGIMYHYFPRGKKEIFQVLILENVNKIITNLQVRNESLINQPIEDVIEQFYKSADEVITENLDLFKILFKEKEVRKLIGPKLMETVISNKRKWFPQYLKKRAEAGEIREMDYDSAAETLQAIMMNHFIMKLTGIGSLCLSDPEHRKKMIDYQVSLWKIPKM